MKTTSFPTCLLLASLVAANTAFAAVYQWNASFGLFPDQVGPAMTLFDGSSPENPQLSNSVLTMQNDVHSELLYYEMSDTQLSMPTSLSITTEVRFVSGTTSSPARTGLVIAFTTAPGVGGGLFIGADEIFLGAASVTRGPSASVDTDDAFHTYRIETTGTSAGSSVQVFQDNVLQLSGTLYANNADFASVRGILFGEGSSLAAGTSEWKSFSHNAAAVGALQVNITPPGAVSAGAQSQVDGGAFQNSGAVVTNLSAGNHTVVFKSVAGWITPDSQIVTISSDTTNIVSVNYTETTSLTLTWINPSGGNWNVAANWSPSYVPGPGNTAILPLAVAVTVDAPTTVANVTLTNGTLNASAGLTVNGTMNWVFGNLRGSPTIAAGGVLNIITGNDHDVRDCTLTNYGTVAWSDGPVVGGGGGVGTVIYNFGLWDAQGDLTFTPGGGGMPIVFHNAGTFRKSAGNGTTTMVSPVNFNHTGLLEVVSGSLSLQGGGNFTGGTTTNAGGLIQLAAGNYLVDGTITTTNVQLIGGRLHGGSILRGELMWVQQSLGTVGAAVTVASNSVLHIVTANDHDVRDCTLTNYGTVAWSGGPVVGGGGGVGTVIYNFGLWDAQNDLSFSIGGGGFSTVFNNAGTFRKSGGTGSTTMSGGLTTVRFNNTGLMDVRTGVLSLQGGGSFTGGTTTNAGGVIQLAGGTFLIDGTVTTTNVQLTDGRLGSGSVLRGELIWAAGNNVTLGDGVTVASNSVLHIVTANDHDVRDCTLTNYGTVAWSGGPVVGGGGGGGTVIYNFGLWDAQNDLNFNIGGGGFSTVFNNAGTFRKSGGTGATTFASGVSFGNSGLMDVRTGVLALQGGGKFTGGTTTNAGGVIQLAGGAFLINGTTTTTNVQLTDGQLGNGSVLRGELIWAAGNNVNLGTGVTVASNSVLHIVTGNNHDVRDCTLTNYGTVAWSGGPVVGGGGGGGTVIYNFGLWDAQNDLTFSLGGGGFGTVFNNAGTFRKSGGTATLFMTSGVHFNNTGVLDLRTGTLNLAGPYTLAGGTLNSRLNSLTDFGRLSLGGSAALGGPLNVTLNGSFIPALSNQFQIVSCNGLSGTFTSRNVPLGFDVLFANNGVFLALTSAVPVRVSPPQLSGSDFTFSFPTANGESYTVQRNDDLNTTNWVPHTNFIGNGLPAQIFAPLAGVPQRFFRVRSP